MHIAYLLLGGNMGNRQALLQEAIQAIAAEVGTVLHRSSLYETAAWGKTDEPDFLNLAVALATNLPPDDLLDALLQIEKKLGRTRSVRYGARPIDIDIIYYDQLVVDTRHLQLPHPRRASRRFVLEPLAEIAGSFTDPLTRLTVTEMLVACDDPLPVKKYGESKHD